MVKRSGSYVRDSYSGAGSDRGKPLSIGRIHSQPGAAVVDTAETVRPERTTVEPLQRNTLDQRGHEDADNVLMRAGVEPRSDDRFYRLEGDTTYVVTFAESPPVPGGGVGLVEPSENLRNAGVLLDAGFIQANHGAIEATLHVVDDFAILTEDAAIAEMVVVPTAKVSR